VQLELSIRLSDFSKDQWRESQKQVLQITVGYCNNLSEE